MSPASQLHANSRLVTFGLNSYDSNGEGAFRTTFGFADDKVPPCRIACILAQAKTACGLTQFHLSWGHGFWDC